MITSEHLTKYINIPLNKTYYYYYTTSTNSSNVFVKHILNTYISSFKIIKLINI